jgi:hypothetical protein
LDTTQETQIVPDVLKIDTARVPLNVVAKNLSDVARNGIWLSPYRGIPQVNRIPDIDLVYIDSQLRVLQCIQGYRQESMALPQISASSALVLPSGGVTAARIHFGDALELRDAVTGSRWSGNIDAEQAVPIEQTTKEIDKVLTQARPAATKPAGILGWFNSLRKETRSSDRRKAARHAIPGLVTYFSNSQEPFGVKSISTEGFYVMTEERWPVGTSVLVGLQIVNPSDNQIVAMIAVQSKVIRLGTDGVGFAFDDDPIHRNPMLTTSRVEEVEQIQKFLQIIKS